VFEKGGEQMPVEAAEDQELTIDEYMADVGVDMLHAGGMKRTEELAEMCLISDGKSVLDIGCGYGRSSHHLAEKYGCKIFGLDVSKRMIHGARAKTRKLCLWENVNFLVADATGIPFQAESFDIVISEGTTVLIDKVKALREYIRVTKRGGSVGLNELSWMKAPSKAIIERTVKDLRGTLPLQSSEWAQLLTNLGLENIEYRRYRYKSTSWDVIRSLGLSSLTKVGITYLRDPKVRKWVNRQETLFRDYIDYWGYGLYTARKP